MTTMPPESSSAIHTAANTPCEDYGAQVRSLFHAENNDTDRMSSRNPMRNISHNESALDALAALAVASTAVAQPSSEGAASHQHLYLQSQQITSHQDHDILCDNDAMPPPPSRIVDEVVSAESMDACASETSSDPSSLRHHDFTYSTDLTEDYPSMPSSTRSYTGGGRLRSASNPEGMEKWDLYSYRNDRQHFVLPSSILEEELASTRRVLGEIVDEDGGYNSRNTNGNTWGTNQNNNFETSYVAGKGEFLPNNSSTSVVKKSKRTFRSGKSPDSVLDIDNSTTTSTKNSSDHSGSSASKSRKKSVRPASPSDILLKSPSSDEDDEVNNLEPEELLRRARARLLEDLSEGNDGGGSHSGLYGENKAGALTLPHSLTKYKEVYNKNGRIGVYTPAERAAIIHKFNAKRARRVWNKKIRYNCRKNLADRRLRVKGRFVKRSTEATEDNPSPPEEEEDDEVKRWAINAGPNGIVQARPSSRSSLSPLCTVNEEEEEGETIDEGMPDINDEEAGFDPSTDMPFRRPRRYTIT